jgi:hypothetical protein
VASGDQFKFFPLAGVYLQAENIVFGGSVVNQIGGFNPTANANFILFFNKSSDNVGPGDIPELSFYVPAGGSFSFVDVLQGWRFLDTCSFAVSTTGNVYTPSTDEWWVMARGRAI